jgi:hypothetical protein
MRKVLLAVYLLSAIAFPVSTFAQTTPITATGNIYYLGDDIPLPLTTTATSVSYTLESVVIDKDGSTPNTNPFTSETFSGTGRVVNNIAYLPTSMITKRGVYVLSGTNISRRRIVLVDPLPSIPDATAWPYGLIVNTSYINQGAAGAEELYRMGIKFFHFDYSISTINTIGSSGTGQINANFESFINRASQLGIHPIFKLMSHYSQIDGPTNLNGNFYNGLRKIQTYYQGKLKYWTVSNEAEGGGYSQFTAQQLADTVKNMSIVLKGVDPNVKIIAGEFYSVPNDRLSLLVSPAYSSYWDILSGHNVVRLQNGNAPVSAYKSALGSLNKPIWDTEANGTQFGGPSENETYMNSYFPTTIGCNNGTTCDDSTVNTHSGPEKHLMRATCLETLNGSTWVPGFYNPSTPCLGANGYIAMDYNGAIDGIIWGVKTLRANPDYANTPNQKMPNFRQATNFMYGAQPLTRIPNLNCPNPYSGCSPTAPYLGVDGYIYKYGPEYFVSLWQVTGEDNNNSEVVLTTSPSDKLTLFNSQGRAVPLPNVAGQVKVLATLDTSYIRGFTQLPTFAKESTSTDAPYFATQPVTQAVAGKPYYYQLWAYDSDKATAQSHDSLPHIAYQLISPPVGMTLSVAPQYCLYTTQCNYFSLGDALVTWPNPTAGTYTITVRATSNHGTTQTTVNQTYTLTVSSGNIAPQILSQPDTVYARSNYVWWYNTNAWDANADTVTYSLTQSPAGMTIDPSSGFVQWTPSASGSYPVTVRAADSSSASTQSFTIKVDTLTSSGPTARDLLLNWLTNVFDQNSDGKINSHDFAILSF